LAKGKSADESSSEHVMSNIKNLSEFPVRIGNVSISPRSTALIERWGVLQHSDQAKALLNAGVIEPVAAEEGPKAKAKAKKGDSDGVSSTNASNV
jgi:hypothetical protein